MDPQGIYHLFNLIRTNPPTRRAGISVPENVNDLLQELWHRSWLHWYVTKIVNYGDIIFILCQSELREIGAQWDRVIIPCDCDGETMEDRAGDLLYYRVYNGMADAFPDLTVTLSCEFTKDCYCLRCTAVRVIQITFRDYRANKARRVLEEIFRVKYGSSVPNVLDMIMYYYQSQPNLYTDRRIAEF